MAEPAANISIKELEKNQKWWWVAEKKRSKRLDYLRKAIWKKGAIGGIYPIGLNIDLEQARMHTEKARELEFAPDPYVVKFAKMLAHYLDNKTIFITDKAQLVGYMGSLPNTISWNPSIASILNYEVINDSSAIPEPIDASLKIINDVAVYWSGKSDLDKILPHMDLDDMTKVLSGAIGWGAPLSRGGYSNKDYEYIMTGQRAFLDVIAELDRQIDEADAKVHTQGATTEMSDLYDKMNMWEAMKITLRPVSVMLCVMRAWPGLSREITRPTMPARKSSYRSPRPANRCLPSRPEHCRSLSSMTSSSSSSAGPRP